MVNINAASGGALLAGTLSIAAMHALIPSHWLAFAMVGKAKRWPLRRTLTVTALAGAGHVLTTMALGLLIWAAGRGAFHAFHVSPMVEHGASSIALFALGLYFLVPPLLGRGHSHKHAPFCETHSNEPQIATAANRAVSHSDGTPTAVGALILGMTLSPCVDLLPLYVAAASRPLAVALEVSLTLGLATVLVMVTLVWMTAHGLKMLNFHWLEHNEGLVVGLVLIALGALLFYF